MHRIYLFLSFVLASYTLSGQTGNTTIGLQLGNHLSLPSQSSNAEFQGQWLLRYSAGILGRTVLKENIKIDILAGVRRGVLTVDYGLQMVFNGYNYQLGALDATTEGLYLELPLLFCLYDTRNIFLPRKMLRRGLTTFVRGGFKIGFSTNRQVNRERFQNGESVMEDLQQRPVQVLASYGLGLVHNRKNGNRSFFELAINLALLRTATGRISYTDAGGKTQNSDIRFGGSYLSANVAFMLPQKAFKWLRWGKTRPSPIIYNPRLNP
ncbi:MAG: hypothetical protein KTR30_23585 [Saprospiraceae bacterium]|nr:hypothetical protein [Saprospiraceae bacterium]